ncbi:MAG: translation elongation factor Ts [Candidatus Hydrothermota bacterium]|nr:MAG: translation elongation factor Ts [Candidatus Hydrothermae bacterium]
MAKVSMDLVKELRARTGAGLLDCKKALEQAEGDIEKAIEILRKMGIAKAEKKMSREAKEGIIEAYIHPGAKLGVLVEVNCETDFVANTPEFKQLAHDLAMQIAASDPMVVSREDLPQEVIEKEKEIYRAQLEGSKKPPHVIERIIEGKLEKFYQEVVLLEQPFIKDPSKTVGDLIKEHIAKFGENIKVRRFARFRIGEE